MSRDHAVSSHGMSGWICKDIVSECARMTVCICAVYDAQNEPDAEVMRAWKYVAEMYQTRLKAVVRKQALLMCHKVIQPLRGVIVPHIKQYLKKSTGFMDITYDNRSFMMNVEMANTEILRKLDDDNDVLSNAMQELINVDDEVMQKMIKSMLTGFPVRICTDPMSN